MLTVDYNVVAPWVAGKVGMPIPSYGGTAIGWLRDDELTCGISYEHFTGSCITANMAMEPGAVMPKQFLFALFDYPFRQLNCKQMIVYVAEDNWRCRNMVEKMGFYEVARIADVFPDGAMLVYVMKRSMCRFLGEDNG